MSTELAVRSHGALTITADQTWWTDEQSLVLRQAGIDDDVTEAELRGFLHLCQRTELDPFSRQIYLIGRWDKRAQRKVFTPQTAIDGYRVVRDRVIERTAGSLSYDDFVWCGPDGEWRDVWVDDTTPPVAAKVTVYRNGGKFSAVAKFSEYVQTDRDGKRVGLWSRMPAGQLAKCAEALALRKAFPHDLAGVYTAEEMAQADNPAADQRPQQQPARPVEDDPWQVHPATPQAPKPAAAAPEYAEVVDEQPAAAPVQTMPEPSPLVPFVELDQIREVGKLLHTKRTPDQTKWNAIISNLVRRGITDAKQLTKAEATSLIERLTAEPDRDAAPAAAGPTPNDPELPAGKSRAMHALFREKGIESSEDKHAFIRRVLGYDIETMAKITRSQGEAVIKALTTGEIPVHTPTPQGIAPSDEGFDEFAALTQMIHDVHDEASFQEAQKAIDAEAAAGSISAEDQQLLRERLADVVQGQPAGVGV